MTAARRAVEAVWRMESARIVGALARYTRDFALAEDLAQEALAAALVGWAVDGVPDDPTAWLLSVGRRRAIDAFRRRAAGDERYALLARDLVESTPGVDVLFDPERIADDRLALIFTACHPVLPRSPGSRSHCAWSVASRATRSRDPFSFRCRRSRRASPAPRRL